MKNGQHVLYCAGQASMDADGRPVHPGDMRAQFTQCLNNLETVLIKAGYTLSDVVRLNYYTTNVDTLFQNWDVLAMRLESADFAPAVLCSACLVWPPQTFSWRSKLQRYDKHVPTTYPTRPCGQAGG